MNTVESTNPGVIHDLAGHRFVAILDGHHARLDYEQHDGVLVLVHTEVPAAIGGRGIASGLMRAAVAHARDEGLKVRPACSYAETWLRRHREYDDLRVPA